jgi:hypothetical protein
MIRMRELQSALLVAIVVVTAVFTTIGNLASPASACWGIGCIEQGGPG